MKEAAAETRWVGLSGLDLSGPKSDLHRWPKRAFARLHPPLFRWRVRDDLASLLHLTEDASVVPLDKWSIDIVGIEDLLRGERLSRETFSELI